MFGKANELLLGDAEAKKWNGMKPTATKSTFSICIIQNAG